MRKVFVARDGAYGIDTTAQVKKQQTTMTKNEVRMRLNQHARILTAVACLSACVVLTGTDGVTAQKDHKIEAKTVVPNLDNPSGVVVQPRTGHVFIASHEGVHRYDPKSGKAQPEIVGYPTDIYGKGPKYKIGPLGLAFLSHELLVVGDGSRPDGEELVRIYQIPAEASAKPQREDAAAYTLGPIVAGEQSALGEGNFYGVACNAGAIFVTCNGDDTKGWVAKALVQGGKPGELQLAFATKVATGVNAPGPITFNPAGDTLVIGQIGAVNVPADSLLTMYDPATGKLKASLKTGLNDILGLAYSPKTSHLYATDFAWVDPTQGGLFRLDVKDGTVKPTKILSLDKPAGLAFDAEGNLYICVLGSAKEGSTKPPGALLRIDAGL